MFATEIALIASICAGVFLLIYPVYRILRNPFMYPYFSYSFDVSGKRNVNIEDCLDNFLRVEENWRLVQSHQREIEKWKKEKENYIQASRLCKYRTRQYHNVLDDDRAFSFEIIRLQTRYRQQNYVKTSYKTFVTDSKWTANWEWLKDRHEQLKKIDFESTLREYNSKDQRKLMTPSLRKKIMIRDHYTCQNCGKYMPDEIGLQIDHIIPIAKGGKSIPSNLRVLCSKCNGSKGAR